MESVALHEETALCGEKSADLVEVHLVARDVSCALAEGTILLVTDRALLTRVAHLGVAIVLSDTLFPAQEASWDLCLSIYSIAMFWVIMNITTNQSASQ